MSQWNTQENQTPTCNFQTGDRREGEGRGVEEEGGKAKLGIHRRKGHYSSH